MVDGKYMRFAKPFTKNPTDYLEIQFNQFQLIGRSIAGVETIFTIPQWNITFDSGKAPDFCVTQDYLALTHWHLDHAGGVASILGLRCLNDLGPLTLVVPLKKLAQAEEYLTILKKISESQIQYQIRPASQTFMIKKGFFLKSLPSFHCTESTGYCVESQKHQLKPEFQNKPAELIIQAKKKGVEINELITEMVFAFSGDSRGEFLDSPANAATCLVMECSFFGDESEYEKVRLYGHTHIHDWRKYADKIQSKHVIMSHTSQRYTKKEIEEACQKNLPKHLLDRLIVFR